MSAGPIPLAALIPGAGLSRRMGLSKPLLPLGHTDFIGALVGALRDPRVGVERIVVVHRAEDEAFGARLAELNTDLHEGEAAVHRVALLPPGGDMLFSIGAGWRALGDCPGALVWPVDAPLVAVTTVAAVLNRARQDPARVVRPSHGGRAGHPLWVPGSLLSASLGRAENHGLRGLVEALSPGPLEVLVDDPGCLVNINTPQAYASLCASSLAPHQPPRL